MLRQHRLPESQSTLTRRGVGAAIFAIASAQAGDAGAAAPFSGAQVPGFRRFRVGRFEVMALLDGHLGIPLAFFTGGARAEELLDGAFLPRSTSLSTPVNAFVVNTGERLHVIDAGTNIGYLPALSHSPTALSAAGIAPEAVDCGSGGGRPQPRKMVSAKAPGGFW